MSITDLERIGVALALCLMFTFLNMKTSDAWLARLTIGGVVGFLALASYLAVTAVL